MFDLINVRNENFKTAFYFSLRNTLVCENLDKASEIAYGQVRHRCVTLNGVIIDQSGSMSGGGKPRRGGMGQSFKNNDFQKNFEDNYNDLIELKERKMGEFSFILDNFNECEKKYHVICDDQLEGEKELKKFVRNLIFFI